MKKTITSLAFVILVLSSALNAQDFGTIIIRNGSDAFPKFVASINGIRLSNEYSSTSTFNMLDETTYRIKMLQSGSENPLTFTLSSEPMYLSKFILMKDRYGKYTMMLESKSIIIEEKVEAQVSSLTPAKTAPVTNNLSLTKTANTQNVTTTSKPEPVQLELNPAASTSIAVTAISTADFNSRLAAVKKAHFDKDRIGKAKQVFDDQYLSTNQVIQVVKAFSFDDSKLEFAKWGYKNTIDKSNYYQVDDHLSFGSSKAALRDYVKKQPKE